MHSLRLTILGPMAPLGFFSQPTLLGHAVDKKNTTTISVTKVRDVTVKVLIHPNHKATVSDSASIPTQWRLMEFHSIGKCDSSVSFQGKCPSYSGLYRNLIVNSFHCNYFLKMEQSLWKVLTTCFIYFFIQQKYQLLPTLSFSITKESSSFVFVNLFTWMCDSTQCI